MICIGGAAARATSDACIACLEPRCTRRTEGAQKRCATEGGRVPQREGDVSARGEKVGVRRRTAPDVGRPRRKIGLQC